MRARQAVDPRRSGDGFVASYPLHGSAPVSPVQGRVWCGSSTTAAGWIPSSPRSNGRPWRALGHGYYDRRDLPFYWSAADRYELFDRFFASLLDGTGANRAHWVAGTPDLKGPTVFDGLEEAGVSWKFSVQNYGPKKTYRSSDDLATRPPLTA
jgi:phospholipase C